MSQELEKTFCPWCRQLFDMDIEEVGDIKQCPKCSKPVEYARKTCRKVDEVKFKHGLLPKRVSASGRPPDLYDSEERRTDATNKPAVIGARKPVRPGVWEGTREITSLNNVFRFFLINGLLSVALHVAIKLFLNTKQFVPAGSEWLMYGPLAIWYAYLAYATEKNYGGRWFGIAWLIFGGGTFVGSLGLSAIGILNVRQHCWQAVPVAIVLFSAMLAIPVTRKYIPYILGVAIAALPIALVVFILCQCKLFWP